jgi:methylase of polypeptide subunit release factors
MNERDELRKRRALSHVGGPADLEGHPEDARALAYALDVPPSTDADDDPSRQHVHGFHTYPARLHPDTAGRLVRAFVPPGGRVLDPFCGSGTVLVESLIAGRRPVGADLNPLAVLLARCKTRPRTEPEVEHLLQRAHEVAAHADDRRKARAGATRRFPLDDVELFEPHVLLELDSLRDGIETLPDEPARLDLLLVLSACLVKLSKKRGDTTDRVVGRRTAGGFAARYFALKAEDLARRFGEFARLLPSPLPPPAAVAEDDATELRSVRGTVDGIVTSPPYASTYDYVAHHALRMRWLGLDPSNLARNELGSRSTYREVDPREARAVWGWELSRFLKAAARVLPPGGPLVMVIGDTAVAGVPLFADRIVAEVASRCGFEPAARASQPRPHFHGPTVVAFRYRSRHEHALLLRRA